MGTFSLVIALVVSACEMPSKDAIKAELAKIQAAYPQAKVSVRIDKKCLK